MYFTPQFIEWRKKYQRYEKKRDMRKTMTKSENSVIGFRIEANAESESFLVKTLSHNDYIL